MSVDPTAGPASTETFARIVERHPDFRVLRRLREMRRVSAPERRSRLIAICALDVETTGLDYRTDAVIELAMQRFRADEAGRIVDVGPPFRWRENPGIPIPAAITRLTGIDAAAVSGRSICEGEATCLILDADLVVAHNAGFDRPFVEKRLPIAAGKPWICSMRDIDWRAIGFEGRVLSHLLSQMGWFYEAHRADVDVTALLQLLDHSPPGRPTTVLAEAVAKGARPSWIVEAVGAPFEAKDALKARGYSWNALERHWWREIAEEDFDEEMEWSVVHVFSGRARPRFRAMDWTSRYAAR